MTIDWSPSISDPAGPAYQAIVSALESDIARGSLTPGDRLPTHRELATRLGVAVGTITRAYHEGIRRGLIRGEVGRGSFVADPSVNRNPIESVMERGVIDLGPTWPLHESDPDLAASLRRLAARPNVQSLLRYQPHLGKASHRAAGARWVAKYGLQVDPDRVVICAGLQHALLVVLATVADAGDTVLTESLTYPGIKAATSLLKLRLRGIAIDEQGIIPAAFENACRQQRPKALYCVPTLQNPTTAIMPARRKKEIAEIARRYRVPILEDDVHRLLVPDASPAIATYLPEQTYFLAGMSKTVSGALRIAHLVVPEGQNDRLEQAIWASIWMVAPLMAELATMWIEDGTADGVLLQKRARAAERQKIAREILRGYDYQTHENALHIWLPLPRGWTSADFASRAMQHGVVVAPAEAFAVRERGAPAAVRISLSGAENSEQLIRGLRRLVSLLEGRTSSETARM